MSDLLRASAGTLESSDVQLEYLPTSSPLEIELNSAVQEQYGPAILATVKEILERRNVRSGRLLIRDRGALDCTIRARLETCLDRAGAKGALL